MKLGLNPEVENALIEKESKEPIDALDAKGILAFVLGGVISPEQARRRLGLSEEDGGKPDGDKR